MKVAFSMLIAGLIFCMALGNGAARGAVVQPCLSNAATGKGGVAITFLPIQGTLAGGQKSTYCQSAFGWSDTWFVDGQPAGYSGGRDAFSGDDAPSLGWKGMTGAVAGTQPGWLGPWLDGGTLQAQYLKSDWSVVPTLDVKVSGNAASSAIQHTNAKGVNDVLINIKTVINNGVAEVFDIKNISDALIQDFKFSDYFNFHPWGSGTGHACAITSYANGTIKTVASPTCGGGPAKPLAPVGFMYGSQKPNAWEVGTPAAVTADVVKGVLNGNAGPTAKGDYAGALQWNLGDLEPGNEVLITVYKNIPEPGSLVMVLFGLAALAVARRHGRLAAGASAALGPLERPGERLAGFEKALEAG